MATPKRGKNHIFMEHGVWVIRSKGRSGASYDMAFRSIREMQAYIRKIGIRQ